MNPTQSATGRAPAALNQPADAQGLEQTPATLHTALLSEMERVACHSGYPFVPDDLSLFAARIVKRADVASGMTPNFEDLGLAGRLLDEGWNRVDEFVVSKHSTRLDFYAARWGSHTLNLRGETPRVAAALEKLNFDGWGRLIGPRTKVIVLPLIPDTPAGAMVEMGADANKNGHVAAKIIDTICQAETDVTSFSISAGHGPRGGLQVIDLSALTPPFPILVHIRLRGSLPTVKMEIRGVRPGVEINVIPEDDTPINDVSVIDTDGNIQGYQFVRDDQGRSRYIKCDPPTQAPAKADHAHALPVSQPQEMTSNVQPSTPIPQPAAAVAPEQTAPAEAPVLAPLIDSSSFAASYDQAVREAAALGPLIDRKLVDLFHRIESARTPEEALEVCQEDFPGLNPARSNYEQLRASIGRAVADKPFGTIDHLARTIALLLNHPAFPHERSQAQIRAMLQLLREIKELRLEPYRPKDAVKGHLQRQRDAAAAKQDWDSRAHADQAGQAAAAPDPAVKEVCDRLRDVFARFDRAGSIAWRVEACKADLLKAMDAIRPRLDFQQMLEQCVGLIFRDQQPTRELMNDILLLSGGDNRADLRAISLALRKAAKVRPAPDVPRQTERVSRSSWLHSLAGSIANQFANTFPEALIECTQVMNAEGEHCVMTYEHVCSAVFLDAVHRVIPRSVSLTDDERSTVLSAAKEAAKLVVAQFAYSPQMRKLGAPPETFSSFVFPLDRAEFNRLAGELGKMPVPSPYAGVPADTLGWLVYEPVLRRTLARRLRLDESNPYLAFVLNPADRLHRMDHSYAENMLSAMKVVGRQVLTKQPMDGAQLMDIHRCIGGEPSPGSGHVFFRAYKGRTLSDLGYQQVVQTIAFLNDLADKAGAAGTPYVIRVHRGDSNDVVGASDIDKIGNVIVDRLEFRPLRPENNKVIALKMMNSIFARYYARLEEINAMPPGDSTLCTRLSWEAIVETVQFVEVAHWFVDGNSRLSAILLMQRLAGELKAAGKVDFPAGKVPMFSDTWIDALHVGEAADLIEFVGTDF
jgi:hypothetical protein